MENSKDTSHIGRNTSGRDSSTEDRIQQDCFIWAWNTYPKTRGLLCYNLNNSKNKIDGNLNKGKGLIAGRADLTFYWNKTAYFIEMKTQTGTQQPNQKEWEQVAKNAGFEYHICRNLEQFKVIFTDIYQRKHAQQSTI